MRAYVCRLHSYTLKYAGTVVCIVRAPGVDCGSFFLKEFKSNNNNNNNNLAVQRGNASCIIGVLQVNSSMNKP